MSSIGHLDEDGNPCTEHPVNLEALLTYAAIGSRVSSFNHDIASKLQGMMMALDEIEEMFDRLDSSDLQRATETAQASLKEANGLLQANRALTRTSTKTKARLDDLVKSAGDRVGVTVRGTVPDGEVETVIPLLAHALGLAIDGIAGTGRGRFVDLIATRTGDRVSLIFASTAEPAKTLGDALALASFVVMRANGELRCGRDRRLHVQLPVVG